MPHYSPKCQGATRSSVAIVELIKGLRELRAKRGALANIMNTLPLIAELSSPLPLVPEDPGAMPPHQDHEGGQQT